MLMVQTYSHLYDVSATTGLRFFTVYGLSPMGRPDMAYFDFTDW